MNHESFGWAWALLSTCNSCFLGRRVRSGSGISAASSVSVDQRLPEEPALEEEQQQLEKKLPGEPGQTGIFGGLFPEGRNVVFSRAVWDRSEAQPGHCWVLLIPVPDPRAWWHWRWGEPSGSPHRQPFAAQAKKNSCCLHPLAWLRCSVNSHRCLFPWSL